MRMEWSGTEEERARAAQLMLDGFARPGVIEHPEFYLTDAGRGRKICCAVGAITIGHFAGNLDQAQQVLTQDLVRDAVHQQVAKLTGLPQQLMFQIDYAHCSGMTGAEIAGELIAAREQIAA